MFIYNVFLFSEDSNLTPRSSKLVSNLTLTGFEMDFDHQVWRPEIAREGAMFGSSVALHKAEGGDRDDVTVLIGAPGISQVR
jgi:hypothetical protein